MVSVDTLPDMTKFIYLNIGIMLHLRTLIQDQSFRLGLG